MVAGWELWLGRQIELKISVGLLAGEAYSRQMCSAGGGAAQLETDRPKISHCR